MNIEFHVDRTNQCPWWGKIKNSTAARGCNVRLKNSFRLPEWSMNAQKCEACDKWFRFSCGVAAHHTLVLHSSFLVFVFDLACPSSLGLAHKWFLALFCHFEFIPRCRICTTVQTLCVAPECQLIVHLPQILTLNSKQMTTARPPLPAQPPQRGPSCYPLLFPTCQSVSGWMPTFWRHSDAWIVSKVAADRQKFSWSQARPSRMHAILSMLCFSWQAHCAFVPAPALRTRHFFNCSIHVVEANFSTQCSVALSFANHAEAVTSRLVSFCNHPHPNMLDLQKWTDQHCVSLEKPVVFTNNKRFKMLMMQSHEEAHNDIIRANIWVDGLERSLEKDQTTNSINKELVALTQITMTELMPPLLCSIPSGEIVGGMSIDQKQVQTCTELIFKTILTKFTANLLNQTGRQKLSVAPLSQCGFGPVLWLAQTIRCPSCHSEDFVHFKRGSGTAIIKAKLAQLCAFISKQTHPPNHDHQWLLLLIQSFTSELAKCGSKKDWESLFSFCVLLQEMVNTSKAWVWNHESTEFIRWKQCQKNWDNDTWAKWGLQSVCDSVHHWTFNTLQHSQREQWLMFAVQATTISTQRWNDNRSSLPCCKTTCKQRGICKPDANDNQQWDSHELGELSVFCHCCCLGCSGNKSQVEWTVNPEWDQLSLLIDWAWRNESDDMSTKWSNGSKCMWISLPGRDVVLQSARLSFPEMCENFKIGWPLWVAAMHSRTRWWLGKLCRLSRAWDWIAELNATDLLSSDMHAGPSMGTPRACSLQRSAKILSTPMWATVNSEPWVAVSTVSSVKMPQQLPPVTQSWPRFASMKSDALTDFPLAFVKLVKASFGFQQLVLFLTLDWQLDHWIAVPAWHGKSIMDRHLNAVPRPRTWWTFFFMCFIKGSHWLWHLRKKHGSFSLFAVRWLWLYGTC